MDILSDDQKQKVKQILVEQFAIDIEDIQENSELGRDLGLDMLDIVELTMALEMNFDCGISDEDMHGLDTISDVYRCLEKVLKINA